MSISKSLVPVLRQLSKAGGLLRISKCHQRFFPIQRRSISAIRLVDRGVPRWSAAVPCQVRYSSSETEEPSEKPGVIQRFKQMYKNYWYVLVPVHVVTSCVWFGSFYYASSSGVDIAAVLEWMNLSESIVQKFKSGANPTAGHLAVSYLLYKIFTPLRYTVTLGGTTYAIKYLSHKGYIKPVPSSGDIKKMIKKRTDSMRGKRDQMKENSAGEKR